MASLLKKKILARINRRYLLEKSKDVVSSSKRVKKRYLFIFLAIAIALTLSFKVLHLYEALEQQLSTNADVLLEIKQEDVATKNILESSIPWSDRRQRIVLFMGDQILSEWKRVGNKSGAEKAFLIAENNMLEAEKYPDLDPLLLLALQWKESSFRDSVVSPVGAVGLCQIMPPTGRMLMGYFQLEYSDRSLYNVETNIRLSAKFLDILYQSYGDYGQVLAYYNGGHWGRYYYATNNPKLAQETSDYVPKVLNKWEEYKEALITYNVNGRIAEPVEQVSEE
jgi:soluble lytic murein transglycosylase-like protein